MYLFEYNQPQMLEAAQMKQAALRKETERARQVREAALAARRHRRFHRMYQLRHWLFRLAPRYARLTL